MTHRRTLLTAALPYANGNLHLGHLLEYVLADIFTRARKAMGEDIALICASDAHGTPIEMNAAKLGVTPEALVEKFRAAQLRDFARFDVAFDHFGSTHGETNRQLTSRVFKELQANHLIAEREQMGSFCPKDQRFLPDRFIRGTCPRCHSEDQYGDVCEKCGATYTPQELKEPRCALCGATPEQKSSQHLFVLLSRPEDAAFLRAWIDSGTLQDDVANYVRSWIDQGLRDWNISRDGPYFGFPIPGYPNKFFYVWLDAPLGYVAASTEWGEKNGLGFAELWQSSETRIEHLIGKDIMYFHTLFWPAVLKGSGMTLPSKVHVHGMLTVDGEKMSKSRGTFINAETFAEHVEPQALRYYLATKYSPETRDVDFSLDDFVTRVNSDLVNKVANLISRVGQFFSTRLDNKLGTLSDAVHDTREAAQRASFESAQLTGELAPIDVTESSDAELAHRTLLLIERIRRAYARRDIAQAMRDVGRISDIGNELMQVRKPWDEIKRDKEAARATCTLVANICEAVCVALAPVVPRLTQDAAALFGFATTPLDGQRLFALERKSLGTYKRLMERIERKQLDAIVAATRGDAPAAQKEADKATDKEASALPDAIDIKQFGAIALRVGRVLKCEPVPKSKKLLRFEVDLGEPQPRQILSGIAQFVEADAMVDKNVVVVANLKPIVLMGLTSHGMILSAEGSEGTVVPLAVASGVPAGATVR